MASNSTFPDEIIIEILLRLPVKSILQCNSLSKHYYSLIHSQYFIRRHLNHGRLNGNFNDCFIACPISGKLRVFNRRSDYFKVLECSSYLVYDSIYQHRMSDPVDGLYCLIDYLFVTRRRAITIWNPATLEEFFLPAPPLTLDEGTDDATRERILASGFGYDSNTDSYKVLLIYGNFADTIGEMRMYIFNVNQRTWIYHEEHIGPSIWRIRTGAGVFLLHGACHWIIEFAQRPTKAFPLPTFKILGFDMSMESSRIILFPDVDVADKWEWFYTSIATLNGCLALISAPGAYVKVWVMAEYGVIESWSIMYRVSLQHQFGGHFVGITDDRLYVIEGEGDGWLVSYGLDSKDVENYDMLGDRISSMLPYEESLVRITHPPLDFS